jgi:hypothetical protein
MCGPLTEPPPARRQGSPALSRSRRYTQIPSTSASRLLRSFLTGLFSAIVTKGDSNETHKKALRQV